MYINNQQTNNSNEICAHKPYFPNNFEGAISEYNGVLHCEGYDCEEFVFAIIEAALSEPFLTRRMKMLSRSDGFMLFGKMAIDFFSTFELLYPNMKVRLRLIRVRRIFCIISDNPNVSRGIVDCSLYNRRIAFEDDYHRKKWRCLRIFPWSTTSCFKKTFLKVLQFVELPLQWIQTLHSRNLTLKVHSVLSNSTWGKLEYSEEVSQP